jgi:pimeloyl-ACP methyl ester carboxylesterase
MVYSTHKETHMKQLFPRLCILALLFCAGGVTQAQTYQIIGTTSSNVANNVTKTETTVQVGSNPLNRFLMTRVRKNVPNDDLKGTILLLPPLGSGFQNYEVGDGGDYDNSFAGFFARRNYDVWGYSQRVQGLTAGSCESNTIDCSVTADWGMQTIVDDVAFIRQQIEAAHPGEKPVVGGLSLGSIASIATINAHPSDYAGAILIEGTLYDENTDVRNINTNFCAGFNDLRECVSRWPRPKDTECFPKLWLRRTSFAVKAARWLKNVTISQPCATALTWSIPRVGRRWACQNPIRTGKRNSCPFA